MTPGEMRTTGCKLAKDAGERVRSVPANATTSGEQINITAAIYLVGAEICERMEQLKTQKLIRLTEFVTGETIAVNRMAVSAIRGVPCRSSGATPEVLKPAHTVILVETETWSVTETVDEILSLIEGGPAE